MAAGGSLDIRMGQEVNMEELKKTKGVWAIRVRETDAGRSAGALHRITLYLG